MLRVDADALRALAKKLIVVADSISGIAAPPAVVIPESAIEGVSRSAADAVSRAHQTMADQIHAMSSAADSSATSYETADAAFKAQLEKYKVGQP